MLEDAAAPLAVTEAYTLFSPTALALVETARWIQQGQRFFGAGLTVLRSPATLTIRVEGQGPPTDTHVITVPIERAPALVEAALEGVRAMGGAGFDVLLARSRRLWQIDHRVPANADPRAPLVVAGLLASVLLAPILPPGGGPLFGVKGARIRLEEAGWRA